MKNLYINPEAFYLVKTKTIIENSGVYSKDGKKLTNIVVSNTLRESVGVIQVGNRFFELEKIKMRGLLLPKSLSTSNKKEEYINVEDIQKFPFPEDFDYQNVTLESLRAAYRSYLFANVKTMEKTMGIQNFYLGNILKCNHQSIGYMNTERYLYHVILLKLQNGNFITLQDFLNGKNKYYSKEKEEGKYFVDSSSLQEQTLETVKELSFSKK